MHKFLKYSVLTFLFFIFLVLEIILVNVFVIENIGLVFFNFLLFIIGLHFLIKQIKILNQIQ